MYPNERDCFLPCFAVFSNDNVVRHECVCGYLAYEDLVGDANDAVVLYRRVENVLPIFRGSAFLYAVIAPRREIDNVFRCTNHRHFVHFCVYLGLGSVRNYGVQRVMDFRLGTARQLMIFRGHFLLDLFCFCRALLAVGVHVPSASVE